jgi:DNA-binding response OmpR family regulator
LVENESQYRCAAPRAQTQGRDGVRDSIRASSGEQGSGCRSSVAVVLVYATDQVVRDQVRLAIGRSPAPGVDDVTYLDTSDADEVVRAADEGLPDLLVLDGEAWPTGGLGLCRQLKSELTPCPPAIVLIGRRDDRWLGEWSNAETVLMHPIDAVELARAAVRLLTRERTS